jgi:CRISPR system Cascade subunit CasE
MVMDQTELDDPAAIPSLNESGPLFESRVILAPANPRALFSILGADMRRSDEQFAHRMIWTLFSDAPDTRRQGLFLFHVERNRPFTAIIRSRRPPIEGLGGVWVIEKIRPFDPKLNEGQRLRFRLRAVASHWLRRPGAKRGQRQDVIVSAWHALPASDRTPERLEEEAVKAALDWLRRQGDRCGFVFAPGSVGVLDYDRARIPSERRRSDIRFGTVTYEGILTVTDPAAFRRMLADGLGNGRAFGNGLMQIAPAP